ncbi:MAG: class I SAM-dependent methyltransferase [Acidobacteriales bacterium]|nr:class I SAM-dependent methyltransferase [Terriglobales bacterium]
MDVTNRFVLDFARRFPGAAMLDFGCGAGELLSAARAIGLDMRGCDVYYAGSNTREEAAARGLLGTYVMESAEGTIPFGDASFDLVVNNQVMEHVADLDRTLGEIHRVLRPGGTALSIFPSRDVWREGHIGIPFSHWFAKGSRARFYYTWLLRLLGAGTWKEQAPTTRRWAEGKLAWIDKYTHYRTRWEIIQTYGKYFDNEFREADYIRFRLRDRPWRAPLARLLDLPLAPDVARAIFRKLAFLVIVSHRRDA